MGGSFRSGAAKRCGEAAPGIAADSPQQRRRENLVETRSARLSTTPPLRGLGAESPVQKMTTDYTDYTVPERHSRYFHPMRSGFTARNSAQLWLFDFFETAFFGTCSSTGIDCW